MRKFVWSTRYTLRLTCLFASFALAQLVEGQHCVEARRLLHLYTQRMSTTEVTRNNNWQNILIYICAKKKKGQGL